MWNGEWMHTRHFFWSMKGFWSEKLMWNPLHPGYEGEIVWETDGKSSTCWLWRPFRSKEITFSPSSRLWRPFWSKEILVQSFISVMKTIPIKRNPHSVLHQGYEDHSDPKKCSFSPSSVLWRPFRPKEIPIQSFITFHFLIQIPRPFLWL